MSCEQCGEREAVVHLTQIADNLSRAEPHGVRAGRQRREAISAVQLEGAEGDGLPHVALAR